MPTASKSSTTTRKEDLLPLITPGEILREEFLNPLHLTPNALSLALRVPANRILAIVSGQRAITTDTALRLGRYFGNSPEFWLNLEQNYQLNRAKREKADKISRDVTPRAA
jgi:addiction module HigA family antidote